MSMQGVIKGYSASPLDRREYKVIFEGGQDEVLSQAQVEQLALNLFAPFAEVEPSRLVSPLIPLYLSSESSWSL